MSLWVISGHVPVKRHVRFTPESDNHVECPLRANSGHLPPSFDRLVGAPDKCIGNGETELAALRLMQNSTFVPC